MADRHSGTFIGVAGVAVVAGGVLISIAAAEVSNTTRSLSSNGWFDLGLVLVIVGVALAVIGGVLHFRRKVEDSSTPEVVDTPWVNAPPAATVNPAEWIATCDESGEFPNKALVFNLRHRFGNLGARQTFGPLRCIVTDPDRIVTEATGPQSFHQYVDPIFPGAPSVRPGLYRFDWRSQKSNGEWVDITSGEHEVKAPPTLIVTILEDSQFENWKYIALIAALHVQVTNTTDMPVPVAGYAFTTPGADGEQPWDAQATGDENMSVRREIARRDETQQHGQPLRNVNRIGPRQTISGWFLTPVARKARGGTPACTIIVTDDVRNEYRATLPARPPQVYGS